MYIEGFWKWAEITSDEYSKSGMSTAKGKQEFEFPDFDNMIIYAKNLLNKNPLSQDDVNDFLTVMALDNENEDVLDYAVRYATAEQIRQLANTCIMFKQPHAKWQMAELVFRTKIEGYCDYLHLLSADSDEYVRKRANHCIKQLHTN